MLKAWIRYRQRVECQVFSEVEAEAARKKADKRRAEAKETLEAKLKYRSDLDLNCDLRNLSTEVVCAHLLDRIEKLEAALKSQKTPPNG